MKYGAAGANEDVRGGCILTTYDFGKRAFGREPRKISAALAEASGEAMEEGLAVLNEARVRLIDEMQKRDTGEAFDYLFVNGHEPGDGFRKVGDGKWIKALDVPTG
jgi:hypothetical protein